MCVSKRGRRRLGWGTHYAFILEIAVHLNENVHLADSSCLVNALTEWIAAPWVHTYGEGAQWKTVCLTIGLHRPYRNSLDNKNLVNNSYCVHGFFQGRAAVIKDINNIIKLIHDHIECVDVHRGEQSQHNETHWILHRPSTVQRCACVPTGTMHNQIHPAGWTRVQLIISDQCGSILFFLSPCCHRLNTHWKNGLTHRVAVHLRVTSQPVCGCLG